MPRHPFCRARGRREQEFRREQDGCPAGRPALAESPVPARSAGPAGSAGEHEPQLFDGPVELGRADDERRREEMTGELGAAVAARDRIDADLLVAIENLSAVAAT